MGPESFRGATGGKLGLSSQDWITMHQFLKAHLGGIKQIQEPLDSASSYHAVNIANRTRSTATTLVIRMPLE